MITSDVDVMMMIIMTFDFEGFIKSAIFFTYRTCSKRHLILIVCLLADNSLENTLFWAKYICLCHRCLQSLTRSILVGIQLKELLNTWIYWVDTLICLSSVQDCRVRDRFAFTLYETHHGKSRHFSLMLICQ